MKTVHLVVLRFSAFGDVAMMLPVLRTLFSTYPHLQLTLVTRSGFIPVFQEFKQLRVLAFDPKDKHKGRKGITHLFREIKALKPDGIVDLHGVLRTHVLRILALFNGLKFRQINKGRRAKKQLTRSKNKVFQPLTPTIYRYADVFRKMGFPIDLRQHQFPPKPLLPRIFSEQFSDPNIKWIGIAPFASFEGKRYPLDLMQQVVAYLQRDHQVFLFGAGNEEKEQLAVWENAYSKVYSMAEKHSLADELALIAQLDVMLSMDSANAHLATNYNVPVITLWGVTHPFAGFAAWGQPQEHNLMADREKYPLIPTSVYGNKWPQGYEKAFRTISPKKVIEAVLDRLN